MKVARFAALSVCAIDSTPPWAGPWPFGRPTWPFGRPTWPFGRRLLLRGLGDAGEEEVSGLDVAVDDAGVVRRLRAGAGLREHAERDVRREGAGAREVLAQILAVEELHDHEREAGGGIDRRLQDADDVRGVEAHRGARLAEEARCEALGGARSAGREDLDGELGRRRLVDRLVDGAHPALASEADELVAIEEQVQGQSSVTLDLAPPT